MVPITDAQLKQVAPNIRTQYHQAFAEADAVLGQFGINTTAIRLRHFMAQILEESGRFTVLWEDMNYSAARLVQVWPKRFKPKGPLDPQAYAHQPEKLGNEVYGNRMGNSSTNGYLYRGRGLIQTTGHDAYATAVAVMKKAYPAATVPDFVANPDLLLDAHWCLKIAAAEYAGYGCNTIADTDPGHDPAKEAAALRAITLKVNGGVTGLADRNAELQRAKAVWP